MRTYVLSFFSFLLYSIPENIFLCQLIIPCPTFISEKRQLGKKGFILVYNCRLQSPFQESQGRRKLIISYHSQEQRKMSACMLTCLVLTQHSLLLYISGLHAEGMVLPTVGNIFPHQLIRNFCIDMNTGQYNVDKSPIVTFFYMIPGCRMCQDGKANHDSLVFMLFQTITLSDIFAL